MRRLLTAIIALLASSALHLTLLGLLAHELQTRPPDDPLSVAVGDGTALFGDAVAAVSERHVARSVGPAAVPSSSEPAQVSTTPPATVAAVVE
jgi:hypothetical protein